MVKQSISKLIAKTIGKPMFQPFLEKLYQLNLMTMNYGALVNVEASGELYALNYIKKELPKNKMPIHIFDVGANVGMYTILVLNVFQEFGDIQVFSFEPSKKTFQKLLKNAGDENRTKLFNIGFSNKEEILKLYSDEECSGLASLYNRRLAHIDIEMKNEEEVSLRTIDDFCNEQNIERIQFLKLDIEGHELKTLDGARSTIESDSVDFIQFEFGGTNIDSRTYFQDFFYLLNERYRIYRILPNGLFQIRQYKELYEVFLTTNYLAEHR